jgi:hypothetical protein
LGQDGSNAEPLEEPDMRLTLSHFVLIALMLMPAATPSAAAQDADHAVSLARAADRLEADLVAAHGEAVRPRLRQGLAQVQAFWRPEDGDAAAFDTFVRTHFAAEETRRDAMFHRLEGVLEQLFGLMTESVRQLRMHTDVERGEVLPFDRLLAAYNPGAHLSSDLFANGVAFVVLLNFPLTTLEERLAGAGEWSRRQWAEARLAQRFGRRLPAEVSLAATRARAEADAYISGYNLWMHHLVDEDGQRLFPAGMRLISHWNLRDEIKASYGRPDALERQRMIQQVMERIVTQTIPATVIDNPRVDWNPFTNRVAPTTATDHDPAHHPALPGPPSAEREPDTRYARLLANFHAARLADPYSPAAPTAIARAFDEGREIPEQRVREMFEAVLGSPVVARTARVIEQRLGRPLEPFDIWYDGFKARGAYGQEELDRIVAERYPTAEAFHADIPRILEALDFAPETARWIASLIEVHPSRGAGHAYGAGRRGDPVFLRTRVEAGGMDYKGYNIAIHELGHNVEQILSRNRVDHPLLAGVPNTAFTEALAFVFQARDLELLGLGRSDPRADVLNTLDSFWNTFEIAGVALVDVGVWHWMYDHPDATPTQLRDATLRISRDVWNRYYAPVFGQQDAPLLGIYSHMISYPLYLADYPLGHLIAFQIKQQMERAGAVGPEFVRMAVTGNVVPDLWMMEATGAPVGPDALLVATEAALANYQRHSRTN